RGAPGAAGVGALALGLCTALGALGASRRERVWGGDAAGGAPFVEADPRDPSRVRGSDVEVAERIARGLGGDRSAQFLQVQWSNIDHSVERGDFTLGLSGVEDTPARRARHAVTLSYFEFREVLAVRPADAANIHGLERFFPNTYVDISPVLDQKKRALFAHVSQDGQGIWREHHEVMAAWRGRKVGIAAAEAFVHLNRDQASYLPGL